MSKISIAADLSDLSLPKLLLCILIYAALSAGLHQCWFATRGLDNAGSVNHLMVMFIGDILGTVLLIALIKTSLDLMRGMKAVS